MPTNDDFDVSVNKVAIKSEQFANCYLTWQTERNQQNTKLFLIARNPGIL